MQRVGLELIRKKKAAYSSEKNTGTTQSRDILSRLVNANMSDEIPEDQRLSDEDVLARKYI